VTDGSVTGRLAGKVAIITGGAGGIGLETARLFLAEGARVTIVDLTPDTVATAVDTLGGGDRVLGVAADVTDEAAVRGYVEATVEQFGTIDVLFNNAGIEGKVVPVVEIDVDDFDAVLRVNLRGVFLGLKHVLPVLYAKGSGSVINTSSVGGFHGNPGLAPYVSSKHAVIGITKSVALEAAPYGVRVNSVHPSAVNTRMMRSLEQGYAPDDPEGARQNFAEALPLKRYAEPIDVARLVLFLASDESEFITGVQYRVDGGQGAL
jgi:NAD(P)-dependent dehydrogenase (short-subunit alcohol dehydrogenase family)